MNKILFTLIAIIGLSFCAGASEAQKEAIERKKADKTIRWGEGVSPSQEEAKEKAFSDLISKLSTTISIITDQKTTASGTDFNERVTAVTVGTIENCQEINYREGADWVCFLYVTEASLKKAAEERRETISQLIDLGREQEKALNIADALKYYNWALRMLNFYNEKLTVTNDGKTRDAKAWLSNHIPGMLGNIAITIPEEKIQYNPDDYDKYVVNLTATYNGKPVSALDISYFNGEAEMPVRCKNGEGVLLFPELAGFKTIDVRVNYEYAADGKNYDRALAAAYPRGWERMTFDDCAGIRIPVKINKDRISQGKISAPAPFTPDVPTDAATLANDMKALEKDGRKTIDRTFEENAGQYVAAMKAVEQAIRAKNPQMAQQYFTPEGFRIFELMMGSGKVTVAKSKIDYTVEKSNQFLVGKSIPVAIKVGKHTSNENVVFRFDGATGKIKSLAYALTKRAEDDIFRKADWAMDSRYSLLQFMEDYQTAFALKRADYIESIFSDDAYIIVGSVKPGAKKRFFEGAEMPGVDQVKYTQFNKDEYMRKVREDFRRKSFIQLVFEDTQISKVGGTEDLVDNEVLWIELKQQYTSSNYSDKGYLALQINMRPSGSLINIRTWTPYKVPMEELKERFPVQLDF